MGDYDGPAPTDHMLVGSRWPRDRSGLGAEDTHDWFPTRTVWVRPGGEPYDLSRRHADDPQGRFRVWQKFESLDYWWSTRFDGPGGSLRRREVVGTGQYDRDGVWEEGPLRAFPMVIGAPPPAGSAQNPIVIE